MELKLSYLLSLILSFCYAVPLVKDKQDFDANYDKLITFLRIQATGSPDFSVGNALEAWRPESGVNPDEIGTYFQGDMLHTVSDFKNGLANTKYRWPNGVIPYRIIGNFTSVQEIFISEAMHAYHRRTCIKFVPYDGSMDKDFISIDNSRTGCWSYLGRIGGEQIVNLQAPGCFYAVGVVIHELMHAIGFHHEQSRNDRDRYITINWDNIRRGSHYNFEKALNSTTFGVDYDYRSVMHYSANSFSANGLPTIEPKAQRVYIGQRSRLSKKDVAKIRIMYQCAGSMSTL